MSTLFVDLMTHDSLKEIIGLEIRAVVKSMHFVSGLDLSTTLKIVREHNLA